MTSSTVIRGRQAPCQRLRLHLRRRRGRPRKAGARISQIAGVQAEEETYMIMIQEISTSGTGATMILRTTLESGGMVGRDDTVHSVRLCRCRSIVHHEAGAPGAHGHCGLSWQDISSGGNCWVSSVPRPLATAVKR
eukprot:6872540-Pyramimonas_sp.AAC.1